MRPLALAAWLVLAPGLLAAAPEEPWMRMRPDGEGFYVSVPQHLARAEGQRRTRVGALPTVTFSTSHSFESFFVFYTQYPQGFVERVTPAKLVEAAQQNLVAGTRNRLLARRDLELAGVPVREVEFEADDGRLRSVARLLVSGRRLYTVIGTTRRPGFSTERLRRFVDSFRVE